MLCRRPVAYLFGAAGMVWLGCENPSGEVQVSQTASPIVGGNTATTCQWPSAIMLIGPEGCSGSLVHPRVVVTAKHCLVAGTKINPPTQIGLGETRDSWARTVAVSSCAVHPDNDFGYCILAEDVTDVPIVPAMAPCETSALAAAKPIVEAGFGVIGTQGMVYGTKKWINGTIADIPDDQITIDVTTGSQDGEYFGDSGGPLYFQMPDGTWRVIGEDCCSPPISPGNQNPRISTYVSVPFHVAWAEQTSGIDLTPCHDASGWNPTTACTGFPTNPGDGVGIWANQCQGETTLRQPTCWPADAGTSSGDAGQDGAKDGTKDGSFDANRGDSDGRDSQADSNQDSRLANADGGAADARDSKAIADAQDGGETGADAWDGFVGGGGNAGTGGSGGSGGSGSTTPDSAIDSATIETTGQDGPSDSGTLATDLLVSADARSGTTSDSGDGASARRDPGSSTDGGDAGASEGLDSSAGDSNPASGEAGSTPDATHDGGEVAHDARADQPSTKSASSGCACRSVSDRDGTAWPGFALLGFGLASVRLGRRKRSKSIAN